MVEEERYPYARASADVLRSLGVTTHGLSNDEAREREAYYGPNILPSPPLPGLPTLFVRQFKNHFIYLLLVAAVVSFVISHYTDAIFIIIVVLVNAFIGTFEEWRAQIHASALHQLIVKYTLVLRGGRKRKVLAQILVPGDIIYLESGDHVPADARLLDIQDFQVDESLLTGESTAILKDAQLIIPMISPIYLQQNMIFAGTHVLKGRACAVVTRTGADSEVGKIASSLSVEPSTPPPIVVRLERFTRRVALITVIAVIVITLLHLMQGFALGDTLLVAVALMVSAIPEGLPVAITVTLAVASYFMSKHNVIIRSLPAVEGLGACTLIASDKTGTLTRNEMSIEVIYFPAHGVVSVSRASLDKKISPDLAALATAGVLSNEARFVEEDGVGQGDTVDVAFLALGRKMNLEKQELLKSQPEVHFIPFESERSLVASFHQAHQAEKNYHVYVKGSFEKIIEMCGDHPDKSIWHQEVTKMACKGYRLIAVASGKIKKLPDNDTNIDAQIAGLSKLNFLGVVGILDPIREEVPEAIMACRRAGIQVVMITGDNPDTALAIAKKLHLATSKKEVFTGVELEKLKDNYKKFAETIGKAKVFARVEPTMKLQIVKVLQANGHFVAVTGDGVNDSPALQVANIGVAMGKSGTDIARSVADIILVDDSFASIVKGVFQGRVAYNNIRKVVYLLISTGIAEIMIFVLALAAQMPLPLFATQLLWLNLVTNGIQHITLAFEGAEEDLLQHKPRSPQDGLFDRIMIQQTILSGMTMGAVAFAFFWGALATGWSEFAARNGLLLLMVMFENLHVLNCRSERKSILSIPFFNNKLLLISILGAHGIHFWALHQPWLQDVLRTEPVGMKEWWMLFLLASTVIIVMEIYKYIQFKILKRD
jgi:calcium-translocating P-type ATPase